MAGYPAIVLALCSLQKTLMEVSSKHPWVRLTLYLFVLPMVMPAVGLMVWNVTTVVGNSSFMQVGFSMALFIPLAESYSCASRITRARDGLAVMFWLIVGVILAYPLLLVYGVVKNNSLMMYCYLAWYCGSMLAW